MTSLSGEAADRGRTRATLRALWRGPKIAVLILAVTLTLAVFGAALAPHDPIAINPRLGELPPVFVEGGTWAHPLGTDRHRLSRPRSTRIGWPGAGGERGWRRWRA